MRKQQHCFSPANFLLLSKIGPLGYTLILEEPSLTLLPPALTWLLPFKLGHTLGHLWVHVQNYLNTLFTLHTIYLVITNIWLEIIYNIYIYI